MQRRTIQLSMVLLACACEAPVERVRVERTISNKVDLLFVIDNDPSSSPKQTELRARFPQLVKILDDSGKSNPAHYHIGAISTDVGAGPFTFGNGQCRPGGDGGKMRPVGHGAAPGCMGPTQGLNFINYDQIHKDGAGNPTSNLPPGQDLSATFGCISSVGDKGCGFEQPLESAYRALHDLPPENHDFLREGAHLFVLFISDEEDCSSDPNSDIFDPTKTNVYGRLSDYRCTQFGVACDGKLPPYGDSAGTLMNCVGATAEQGGKLTDVQKYIDFFTRRAFMLTAITGESLMGIRTSEINTKALPGTPCTTPVNGVDCIAWLEDSCRSPQNSYFSGKPAVRVNQVVRAMPAGHSLVTSVCDTSYQAVLEALGQRIVASVSSGCITGPFEDPALPDCTVEDVTASVAQPLPQCGPGVSPPCWRLEWQPTHCAPVCAVDGDPAQHFAMSVDRGPGNKVPPDTTTRFTCTTLAVPELRPTCASSP